MDDGVQDAISDRQLLGLTPTTRRPDLVVRGARKLRPPVAMTLRHCELQELVSGAVVEPVDDLLRDDSVELGIVGQHLYRQLLVDDLADLLLSAVGERHSRVCAEAAEEDPYLFPQLVDEDTDGVGPVEV